MNPNLVRRSTPYSYISYAHKNEAPNNYLEKMTSLIKKLFLDVYCYGFNNAIACANKLKLYQFEKKAQFFYPTLNQTQLITYRILLPYLGPNFEQITIANNYWRTSYAIEHSPQVFKNALMFFPSAIPIKILASYLRAFESFRLLDIYLTAVESYLIIERSFLGLKESHQLYKINKTVAIRSAITHIATFFISLNKIHKTINNPQYISLSECSRLDESKLESLKGAYIKKHGKDAFCPDRAYIKELNETCPEQAIQILNPHRRLEELTKRNFSKDFHRLMLSCHEDKNPDRNNSEEINALNIKINSAKETIDKCLKQATH